jgi:23S rRNA (adenine2503-C2)-methyltransferase
MTNIYQMDRQGLVAWLQERGLPPYRASQILEGVYRHLAPGFDEIAVLPKTLRQQLSDELLVGPLDIDGQWQGKDSVKLLVRLDDGDEVECVAMRTRWGQTACVSTQVGCAVGCAFCASAVGGGRRNLRADEIVRQVVTLAATCGNITNVVFMGMGEPLLNYDETLAAVWALADLDRMAIPARRITVGTSGVAPRVPQLAHDAPKGVELAVSLNAADDELRRRLMPGVTRWPIGELLAACDQWTETRGGQPVTFAHVLIDGVNDRRQDAARLAKLLAGRRHHLNLIRMNPVEGADLQPSSRQATEAFAERLKELGLNVSVRRSLGADVRAACGQLRLRNEAAL